MYISYYEERSLAFLPPVVHIIDSTIYIPLYLSMYVRTYACMYACTRIKENVHLSLASRDNVSSNAVSDFVASTFVQVSIEALHPRLYMLYTLY